MTNDRPLNRQHLLIAVIIFFLALLPRALDLQRFVTADEAKWVYRSAQFLAAFWRGDFPATEVNLTPAVTSTWLGGLGLAVYHAVVDPAPGLSLADWLITLPPFRADLPVLAATRWPMVLVSAGWVALVYLLAARLWNSSPALLGALLLAFDPHLVALSRVIGHDMPAVMGVSLSLLGLLLAFPANPQKFSTRWLFFSGVMAGLACLSKSPAFFLLPFGGLMIAGRSWPARTPAPVWLARGALWLAIVWVTFVAFWPAAWVEPFKQPYKVVENAFFSATGDEDEESAATDPSAPDAMPELGWAYYLVNGAFKLSVAMLLGLALAAFHLLRSKNRLALLRSDWAWLALFALLFGLFMTVGNKQSSRYILPAFPALALVAAAGWLTLRRWKPGLIIGGVAILAGATLLPYAPYYLTYYNPLLGGATAAARLVKIGWGEGMEQAGAWLAQQPHADKLVVGSAYASTIAPFFPGRVLGLESDDPLDYVVLYIKQTQAGSPPPAVRSYYDQVIGPAHTVRLAGLDYAQIYPAPAVKTPQNAGEVRYYRADQHFVPVGGAWTVDLIGDQPAISLADPTGAVAISAPCAAMSAGGVAFSRCALALPTDFPPGVYTLQAGGQVLGVVTAVGGAP